jgi:hypothetical protein
MLVGLYLTSQAQAVTNTVPVVKQEPAASADVSSAAAGAAPCTPPQGCAASAAGAAPATPPQGFAAPATPLQSTMHIAKGFTKSIEEPTKRNIIFQKQSALRRSKRKMATMGIANAVVTAVVEEGFSLH